MINVIAELNKITKATFGSEVTVVVVRSPSFGNDDCCVVFTGRKSKLAAKLFATQVKSPLVNTSHSEFMGRVTESTSVEWK